ncbi:Isocitrate dehydrogenase [NADP] [bioreactor metagenome]|uniref:Isocitrate dehydrogenase [NADP] n=1 Tax=bioreactor metagenome TaxID=1076179 RepID=A0A645DLA0_9ZZZZ
MMTSVLMSPDGSMEFEASHGTVTRHFYRYRAGEKPSTNSTATIFAWTGALRRRGQLDNLPDLVSFAGKLESACLETMKDGLLTGDLAVLVDEGHRCQIVNYEESLLAISKRLAKKMRSASDR